MRRTFISILLLFVLMAPAGAQVVLENDACILRISADAMAESLICKADGRECLVQGARIPLCSILQYRPYDNENFLRYPAKPMSFPSDRITMDNDTLRVEFAGTYDIAVISVRREKEYFAFELERIDYRIEDFGIKRKTEIDELAFFQLPVGDREHFGHWLNVAWDEGGAVCLMGLNPQTRIDSFDMEGGRRMYAGADSQVGLLHTGAALVVSSKDGFLDVVDRIEQDYDMPRGVQARRHEEYFSSYYELRDVTLANIDRHISYARQGGFRMMVIYYMDFASTCGHFMWRPEYPGGMADLKAIVDKIKEAGMIPGFHIHYSKVSVDDPYVAGGRADGRLNAVAHLTLYKDLGTDDDSLVAFGNPSVLRHEDGRRMLQIGGELLHYASVENHGNGMLVFKGLERGVHGTEIVRVDAGTRFIQPDVDDWPRFIRIDQNSDIQDEIASRLAEIYNRCGFRFIYFDGAEDVPYPYWYNVTRAQKRVYDLLEEKPYFCEGALKSHYGWHILSRGNAFDLFRPERVEAGARKYTIPCSEEIANDFTAVNYGWLNTTAPDSTTVGMHPGHYEFICSQAYRHGCPISYVAYLDQMDKSPYTAENLKVIRKWERKKKH